MIPAFARAPHPPVPSGYRSSRGAGNLAPVGLLLILGACNAPWSSPPGEPTRPLRPDSLEHNGWDRDSDLLHVELSLSVDLQAKSIEGSASNRIRALIGNTQVIRFHSLGLELEGVRDSDGRTLNWSLDEPLLSVRLAAPLERGQEQTITIDYSASPEAGLYFRETSKDANGPAPQAWSQGQSEDNRRWIPTWDFPNDRASFSGHFRVARGLSALSNGRLLATEEHPDGERTFHWNLEESIPTYLIALAVGSWEHYADDWEGLPVDYWVGPGTGEEKARRAFGETPEMLSYFSELLGVDYPYSKYGQVAVSEFIYGGMENASLTIQHDDVIATPEEHIENDGETRLLVAHELAHQWFGDLVTCLGWSHLWLNEGWASYLELMFEGHVSGEETFRLLLERYRQDYLSRGDLTRRPLSEDWRTQVSEARCTHEYVKGPWVLYMLEQEIGSEPFWYATNAYLVRHAEGLVQTDDFARSIFDATGRNVEGFIEQWVEAGGHPEYEVRLELSGRGDGSELLVHVDQTQRTSELVPLFDVTVEVEIHDARGATRVALRIDDESNEFRLPVLGELVDFVFDAPCRVLCAIDLRKTPAMWAHQAGLASAPLRWRALGQLDRARRGGSVVADEALLEIAARDEQVILRREALRYLILRRDRSALLQLVREESDPLARLEILELLSRRSLTPEVVAWLGSLFEGYESERAARALENLHGRVGSGGRR